MQVCINWNPEKETFNPLTQQFEKQCQKGGSLEEPCKETLSHVCYDNGVNNTLTKPNFPVCGGQHWPAGQAYTQCSEVRLDARDGQYYAYFGIKDGKGCDNAASLTLGGMQAQCFPESSAPSDFHDCEGGQNTECLWRFGPITCPSYVPPTDDPSMCHFKGFFPFGAPTRIHFFFTCMLSFFFCVFFYFGCGN